MQNIITTVCLHCWMKVHSSSLHNTTEMFCSTWKFNQISYTQFMSCLHLFGRSWETTFEAQSILLLVRIIGKIVYFRNEPDVLSTTDESIFETIPFDSLISFNIKLCAIATINIKQRKLKLMHEKWGKQNMNVVRYNYVVENALRID